MPVIILEGVDGVGKSTLANLLKEQSSMPATILRKGPLKESPFDELLRPLFELGPTELLIADRWHLSELLYGPLYRDESLISEQQLQMIEAVLKTLKASRIILAPPLKKAEARAYLRGENFLRLHHYSLVYNAYLGLGNRLGYNIIMGDDPDRMAPLILDDLYSRLGMR